ncbi:MAG TPA: IS21 family transposase [Anaerovoracaceae bacterium]|nr:IS21 family transposase [Anaerovoracaceae bacterium]
MIKLKTKQEIILMHIRGGKSQREISRITGRDRKTIRKYIREYEEDRRNLLEYEGVDTEEMVSSIVEKPKYNTSNREKKKLTDEVVKRIKFYLDENEKRIAMGIRKQTRKKIDIYEALVEEGIDIGYTTVCQAVSKILNESKEAFIRCEYKPGDTCEFDWGEVKLWIDGILMTLHMAAFCTARGNYRFGRLYTNEKTESFMESHAEFFSHIEGNHRTMVYDNMRTAVKKFVGRYEKEPTEALMKMSMYYCYQYRFCNTYSGNEKGHVEKTVDYLRGKAFARRLHFSRIEEANEYLLQVCNQINDKEQKSMENKTAAQMLEEERNYLMPSLPPFDCAVVRNYRVNKYSTINIDGCFYSVPDNCVDKLVLTKVYTGKIIIFYEGQKLAHHTKLLGYGKWSLDIYHYLNTLKKKPGALTNSLALQQAHTRISNLYEKHFTTNRRDFVELLLFMKEYDISIEKIESAVAKMILINPIDISADKIKFLCLNCDSAQSAIDRQDEIYKNSKNILNLYGQLLNADSDNLSNEGVAL